MRTLWYVGRLTVTLVKMMLKSGKSNVVNYLTCAKSGPSFVATTANMCTPKFSHSSDQRALQMLDVSAEKVWPFLLN